MTRHHPARLATAARGVLGATALAAVVAGTVLTTVPADAAGVSPTTPGRGVAASHAGAKAPGFAAGRADAFAEVAHEVRTEGPTRVTLVLADAPTGSDRSQVARQAAAGRAAAERVLGPTAADDTPPGAPAMTAEVDARELAALRRDPAVRTVSVSTPVRGEGTTTFGIANGVQLPRWWHQRWLGTDWLASNGHYGNGRPVVVIDSGVDATHPWLQGRVVGGACFSSGGCGNGLTYRYGVDAGRPCTYSYACAHGTHVAHIAAGRYGAAPSAGIVAINASHRAADGAPGYDDADLINALWYAYTYVPNAGAVNMSIGDGYGWTTTCDGRNPTIAGWITALRNRGVATTISAGNRNSATQIGYPACMSSGIVVGNATLTSATGVPAVLGGAMGGSNSNSLVDLWAPGTDICSAVPTFLDDDGTADGVGCHWYGTSMAAPQVAGAFAVLRAARPTYTVNQSLTALVRRGHAITDSRNGVTRSMIDIARAVYYG